MKKQGDEGPGLEVARAPESEIDERSRREAFRVAVLEKLAARVLLSMGAAHDINNPAASVTANLSFLGLRAEDLGKQAEKLRDERERAAMLTLSTEIKEVAQESASSMRRIATLARAVGDASGHSRASTPPAARGGDLLDLSRSVVRLLAEFVPNVRMTVRGERAPATPKRELLGQLVLNLILAVLEDGGSTVEHPLTLEIETGVNAGPHRRAFLRARRRGMQGQPLSEVRVLEPQLSLCAAHVEVSGSGEEWVAVLTLDAPRE